jgi:hypothetical protein
VETVVTRPAVVVPFVGAVLLAVLAAVLAVPASVDAASAASIGAASPGARAGPLVPAAALREVMYQAVDDQSHSGHCGG